MLYDFYLKLKTANLHLFVSKERMTILKRHMKVTFIEHNIKKATHLNVDEWNGTVMS